MHQTLDGSTPECLERRGRTRVLVTGGVGFLGSHVVSALQEAGHDVVIFDIQAPDDVAYVRGDLANLDDLVKATQGIDAVCHLAAVGDVYLAFDKPYLAAELNVVGTANLMEACLQNQVAKVVYASTWEVYGEPCYQPIDEAHPCKPDHPYNITKLAGERIALSYDRLKNVPTLALRLGTAYGIRMRPNSVHSIFVARALRGEPLIIKGSGTQSRQFTHARDISHAFLRALKSPARGEAFNIVGTESISISQLAQMIVDRIPTSIAYGEARDGDISSALVSSEKARLVLGWEPRVGFREGLSELMDWQMRASP